GLPDPDQDHAWGFWDDNGRLLRHGTSAARHWPDADRREAVVAEPLGRITTVTLPPVAPARLGSAVAFALEDRLASGIAESHIANSPQQAGGQVRVVIVSSDWMRKF